MDKPEFLNELEDLLIELHATTQEVKTYREKNDEAWKAYKNTSDEFDAVQEKLHYINRIMSYCFNNQCDPTEAKIMLSIEDDSNKQISKNHYGSPVSPVGESYQRQGESYPKQSKIKQFFNIFFNSK
jgi:hypothetical protein